MAPALFALQNKRLALNHHRMERRLGVAVVRKANEPILLIRGVDYKLDSVAHRISHVETPFAVTERVEGCDVHVRLQAASLATIFVALFDMNGKLPIKYGLDVFGDWRVIRKTVACKIR